MSKSFGPIALSGEEAVYVLVRHPYPEKKQTRYEIWVEDDGISITPYHLAQLLAETLQKVVIPSASLPPQPSDKEKS